MTLTAEICPEATPWSCYSDGKRDKRTPRERGVRGAFCPNVAQQCGRELLGLRALRGKKNAITYKAWGLISTRLSYQRPADARCTSAEVGRWALNA